jgi:hypothetical protein
MCNEPPEVYRYSIEQLISILRQESEAPEEIIRAKSHIGYFDDYFNKLEAKTIVLEKNYIDKDFLEDFIGYYVRCFNKYKSQCSRLHFFKKEFTREEFSAILEGRADKAFLKELQQEHYLGFIVVKPLPQTIIGKTCLLPYPFEGRRYYPIKRSYEIHLFGIPFEVRNTLAFQEQDNVVAACATTALWTAFQGTGALFQHLTPSPVEITKAAISRSSTEQRGLPNRGLLAVQMAEGIRSVGLEPHAVRIPDKITIQTTVFAYLSMGIPIPFGIILVDTSVKPFKVGHHAVTATGFSLGYPAPLENDNGLLLQASRMDRIYVHDDGVGPFAKMVFCDDKEREAIKHELIEQEQGDIKNVPLLKTSRMDKQGCRGKIFAIPEILLIPLYHKIRIPFDKVLEVVDAFNQLIDDLRKIGAIPIENIKWEIAITTVNEIKKEMLEEIMHGPTYRKEILIRRMPLFVWKATARTIEKNEKVLDLIFDATDIEQGSYFVRAIEYDKIVCYCLRVLARSVTIQRKIEPSWKALRWFAGQPIL